MAKTRRRISLARRHAALKGWATRRAHERQRQLAARKGWVTRRANERRKKRQKRKIVGGHREKTKRTFHYAGSTTYTNDGGAQQLQFDITADRKLTADEIDAAIRYRAIHDTNKPGIKIRIVAWFDKRKRRHPIKEKDEQRYWDDLRNWIINSDRFDLDEDDES